MEVDVVLALVREIHGVRFTGLRRPTLGESGETWLAQTDDGTRVVLKVLERSDVTPRLHAVVATTEALRGLGYPIPAHGPVLEVPGAAVLVQHAVDGHARDHVPRSIIVRVLGLIDLHAGVTAHHNVESWGELVVHSLVVGQDGWCVHESMRAAGGRVARLLDWIEAVGASVEPVIFPGTGAVHLDYHHHNILQTDDGDMAVIDWGGVSWGDHRFDLVTFAHGLVTADVDPIASADVWERIEATIEPDVLRAYVAHLALRLVDWQLRHHPERVEPWLVEGERLRDRYDG